mmetsp:Transcript_53200/g.164899  ORF Transcript_53200/g.164899 Transcript_53200/m.164899 type:complete len:245 (+) Transcript_53200:180-914(+)
MALKAHGALKELGVEVAEGLWTHQVPPLVFSRQLNQPIAKLRPQSLGLLKVVHWHRRAQVQEPRPIIEETRHGRSRRGSQRHGLDQVLLVSHDRSRTYLHEAAPRVRNEPNDIAYQLVEGRDIENGLSHLLGQRCFGQWRQALDVLGHAQEPPIRLKILVAMNSPIRGIVQVHIAGEEVVQRAPQRQTVLEDGQGSLELLRQVELSKELGPSPEPELLDRSVESGVQAFVGERGHVVEKSVLWE